MTNPMLAELDEVVRLIEGSEDSIFGAADALAFIRTHHAALADMAKRLEAAERDAARYRWLRISACEIAWNEWCTYSPGYSANGPEELDEAIDTVKHGDAVNRAEWPHGCIKPNSCARHRSCMYGASETACRHFGKDIGAAVDAAIDATQEGEG